MTNFFIDQLFMQQDHPEGGLPFVGTHVIERIDLETGEKLPPSVNQKRLEGSFSSKLTIRCNGTRVRVEGNPSRWHRMDNLFGLTSLDDCVSIYNSVLSKYNLPPFTKNTRLFHRQGAENRKAGVFGDGAEITHIDWTRNHTVGNKKEASFIRGMSSVKIGRARSPKLYPNGMTCNWGEASEWNMTKLYCKAFELREHLKKDKRKKNNITDEQFSYINKLIEYCEINGVVREEHSLRQKLLKRHNLQFYGLVTEQDFLTHLKDIDNAMNTLQVSHDTHETIAEQLLNSGAVDTMRKANLTMSYFTMWQHGTNLQDIISRSQYFEHKSRLKKIGIDISQQFDVSRMCPTLKRSEIIEVNPLQIPDWYELPKVANSNVMAFRSIY